MCDSEITAVCFLSPSFLRPANKYNYEDIANYARKLTFRRTFKSVRYLRIQKSLWQNFVEEIKTQRVNTWNRKLWFHPWVGTVDTQQCYKCTLFWRRHKNKRRNWDLGKMEFLQAGIMLCEVGPFKLRSYLQYVSLEPRYHGLIWSKLARPNSLLLQIYICDGKSIDVHRNIP